MYYLLLLISYVLLRYRRKKIDWIIVNTKLVDMIEETAQSIDEIRKRSKSVAKVFKVGLLCSDGTRKANVYPIAFTRLGKPFQVQICCLLSVDVDIN